MGNLAALIFGAGIVVFFSYDRFNQATYAGGGQLERLVGLLSPDKLRARRIVLKAWGFYAIALLIIYLFMCAYAEVLPHLGAPDLISKEIGARELPSTSPEGSAEAVTGFTGQDQPAVTWEQPLSSTADTVAAEAPIVPIDASVSLAIALIIVGLAPTFPMLRRFEDWMRSVAHRLAGIPTHIISAGYKLRQKDIDLYGSLDAPFPTDTLLIPRGDWERMQFYLFAAKNELASPDEFKQDLELILAVSTWVLDGKLRLVSSKGRERFGLLEEELKSRRTVLVAALDEKSGFRPGGVLPAELTGEAEKQGQGDTEPSAIARRASWERIAIDTDKLAYDFCILLALYNEHEIILRKPLSGTVADSSRNVQRQQDRAGEKLLAFLGRLGEDGSASARVRSYTTAAFFWTLGVVVFVSFAWSVWPGPLEFGLQRGDADEFNAYQRALGYVTNALISFCIPVLVALAVRDAGLQASHWRNMGQAYWTVRVPQALILVFVSWAIAVLIIIGWALWRYLIQRVAVDDVWDALRYQFEYNGPSPFRGAVLGLIIVVLLDVRTLVPSCTSVSSFLWAGCAALIMAVSGGVTRALTSWSSAVRRSDGLDAIDFGLIAYAAIYSAIIGFCVVFCVSESLANRGRDRDRFPFFARGAAASATESK
jgi:hypothetical protein